MSTLEHTPLAAEEVRLIDAWWRAANYLSVGQIYLLDNPLLREPRVGEHAAQVRREAVDGLRFLGLAIDVVRNDEVSGDGEVSAGDATARTLVVTAREDLEIARQTHMALARGETP